MDSGRIRSETYAWKHLFLRDDKQILLVIAVWKMEEQVEHEVEIQFHQDGF